MKGRIYNKTGFFGGAGAGLRRFEIAALDVGDLDPAEQSLRVAHGKGDRPRTVYLSDSGARCLLPRCEWSI
jgi:site-specific recombinase XerD